MAEKTTENVLEKALEIGEARRLIEAQEDQRRQACMAEVEMVLRKHNCRMVVIPASLGNNLIQMQIGIEALKEG